MEFMAKVQTAQAIVEQLQTVIPLADTAMDLVGEYWDVANAEGEWTDADVEPLGITAATLSECITFLEQFDALLDGGAVATADRRATLNKVRRV